jgi:hypothetical protein
MGDLYNATIQADLRYGHHENLSGFLAASPAGMRGTSVLCGSGLDGTAPSWYLWDRRDTVVNLSLHIPSERVCAFSSRNMGFSNHHSMQFKKDGRWKPAPGSNL